MQKSVQTFEQGIPEPWTLDDSGTYEMRMLAQIVGFRMQIDKIEGKWKLNQNQPDERRNKVIRALQARGDENALSIAGMMQDNNIHRS